MTENEALALFKCLADKSRLQILKSLMQEDMYVERLAGRLALTPATISFHLKKLEDAGAVTSRKEQYYTMYSIRQEVFSARMIDIVNDGLVFDLWFIYKWGNLINAVTGTLGAGTNNFSSAYASLEAKTNEEIAKTFESLK